MSSGKEKPVVKMHAKDVKSKESTIKKSSIKESQTKDSPAKESQAQDLPVESSSNESQVKKSKVKEVELKESQVKESSVKESEVKGTQVKESQTKGEKSENGQRQGALFGSVSKNVQLDVVELLKQVLQWTPVYKPGLNKALLQAAKVGSVGCVKVLLSTGAEVDAEDDNGDTAFVHAFRARHAATMRLLHEHGATTEIAKMSLALASPRDAAFVRLCAALDVPVENEDWNCGDPAEAVLLMESLALDPFQGQYGRRGFDDSPFMYVAAEGRPDVLETLVSHHPCLGKYSPDQRRTFIDRALWKAVRARRPDNVRLLLGGLGARLDAVDEASGRTAFLLACGQDEAIATYLLELGANWRAVDADGLTALHWAACSGFRTLCEALLERGAEVDARANLGATPLMVACSGRHTAIVELLLRPPPPCRRSIASPPLSPLSPCTPSSGLCAFPAAESLSIDSSRADGKSITILEKNSAGGGPCDQSSHSMEKSLSAGAESDSNRSILHMESPKLPPENPKLPPGNPKLLVDNPQCSPSQPSLAALHPPSDDSIINPFKISCAGGRARSRGADPNLATPEGWRALHVAVRACAPSALVRRLLLAGADPDAESTTLTHNGDAVPASTPLLIAVALDSVRLIRRLMDAGADIDREGLMMVGGGGGEAGGEGEGLAEGEGVGKKGIGKEGVSKERIGKEGFDKEIDDKEKGDKGKVEREVVQKKVICKETAKEMVAKEVVAKEVVVKGTDTREMVPKEMAVKETVARGTDAGCPVAMDHPTGARWCAPVECAIVSRAWDVAELLIRARCNPVPVLALLADGRCGVPRERSDRLRALLSGAAAGGVPKLRVLAREKSRGLLRGAGGHLAARVAKLGVPVGTQQYLLFDELFRAQAGSFEV